MKLKNKLMLDFQKKKQSFLLIMLGNYQFMYFASSVVFDLLKA